MAINSISPAVQQDYRRSLLAQESPSFLDSTLPIQPVADIRRGIPTPSTSQSLKSYAVIKAAAATTQTQIATVSSNERIFFIGVQQCDGNSDQVWIEDADTGALTPSDHSTIPLYYFDSGQTNANGVLQMLPFPRECKRGIRVHNVRTGLTESKLIVYYLVVRTDGQHQAI